MTNFYFEETLAGRDLVLTGRWSEDAAAELAAGRADGLVVNYARGFVGQNLEFLEGRWGLRRLHVLDRGLLDLDPIGRLGDSLLALSVQAASSARLELGPLTQLEAVAGEWPLLRDTLGAVDRLSSVITWRFDEPDLRAFRNHFHRTRMTIKDAPPLISLSGIEDLPGLDVLKVISARNVREFDGISDLMSLKELQLETCRRLGSLEYVRRLTGLRVLGIGDCGDVDSLEPLSGFAELEILYAWGSTRILDDDLSLLEELPRLREVRMRPRRTYKPQVTDLKASVY